MSQAASGPGDRDPGLAALLDRQAIVDLLHEYCRCSDRNDCVGIAACFTDDCLADYGPGVGPPTRGSQARHDDAQAALKLFSATSHHLSNVVVAFDGPDAAVTSCNVYAWHRPVAPGPDWHLWAQYHDRVVRTDGGWRIAERRMLVAGSDGFPPEWGWTPTDRLPSPS